MTVSTVWCHRLDYTKAPAVLPPRASIPLAQMPQYYYENSFDFANLLKGYQGHPFHPQGAIDHASKTSVLSNEVSLSVR